MQKTKDNLIYKECVDSAVELISLCINGGKLQVWSAADILKYVTELAEGLYELRSK